MILEIFAVYDNKAMAYLTPFFLPTVPMAQRAFQDCAQDETHMFCKYPTDYTLFHIGTFDDIEATITNFLPLRSLGFAHKVSTIGE